jgi:hypothetical protein
MKTITAETKAWILGASSLGPKELQDPKCINSLVYASHDMSAHGWTLVGKATITVEVPDEKAIIESKVTALKSELKTVRAEAEARANQIQGCINDLLALTYEPAEGGAA